MTKGPEEKQPYRHTRGPWPVAWCYLVWRQVLAFGDLLGRDGRPSVTKLVALEVINAIVAIGVIRAAKSAEQAWSWPMFWTVLACLAVLFGRTHFSEYLSVLKGKDTPPGLDQV